MPKGATEVGSAYVSIYPDTSHFEDDLNTELSQVNMQGVGKKAGDSFQAGFSPVTVAIGNLLSSAIEGAVSFLGQNLSRGIERLDTLENFPRLMQTFGYATEDAEASIVSIQNHLDGLPGATDEVLRLVQALSDSTGSLDLATSTGLAFNDMLTASGADAYTAMYAMRMFDQMMGGASYSATRWNALVSKMPLQLGLVAEKLLGAGANVAELGDALKDGDVTMRDLAVAMSELGPEFETQARAMSYGIGTAMTNVRNRIAIGMASILDAIGQTNIARFINNMSYNIRDSLRFIAEGVAWVVDKISGAGLEYRLAAIVQNIKKGVSELDWSGLKAGIEGIIDFLKDALQFISENGEAIASVIAGIVAGFAAFTALDMGKNAIVGLSKAIGALVAHPILAVIVAVSALVGALVYFFTQTEKGREIWAKFTSFLSSAFEAAKNAIATIVQGIQAFLTALVLTFEGAFEFIAVAIGTVIEFIIGVIQGAWDLISQLFSVGAQVIGFVIEYVAGVIVAAANVAINIVDAIVGAWNWLVSFVDWVCQGIVDFVVAVVNQLFKEAKAFVKDTKNTVNKIKDLFDLFKRNLKRTWENIKTTAKNVWEGILHAITHPMETAKKAVEGIIGGIQGIINSLTGKTVDVGVNDNRSQVDSIVSDIQRSINSIHDKRVNIEYYGFQSGIKGVDVTTYTTAAGNKRIVAEHIPLRMAAGGIVTKATAAIFGEEGDEAVIPLSNRNRVKPFAKAVAAEIGDKGTVNNYYIDGNLVASDAVLARALDTVAERVNGRRRMGAIV